MWLENEKDVFAACLVNSTMNNV